MYLYEGYLKGTEDIENLDSICLDWMIDLMAKESREDSMSSHILYMSNVINLLGLDTENASFHVGREEVCCLIGADYRLYEGMNRVFMVTNSGTRKLVAFYNFVILDKQLTQLSTKIMTMSYDMYKRLASLGFTTMFTLVRAIHDGKKVPDDIRELAYEYISNTYSARNMNAEVIVDEFESLMQMDYSGKYNKDDRVIVKKMYGCAGGKVYDFQFLSLTDGAYKSIHNEILDIYYVMTITFNFLLVPETYEIFCSDGMEFMVDDVYSSVVKRMFLF